MKLAHILLAATIALSSCRKDKSKPSDTGTATKKITRIEEDGNSSASFTYNGDGKIKTLTMSGGGTNTVFTFSYNDQKKPVEMVNDKGVKAKYIYDAGGLKMIENYDGTFKISENHFTYENGRVKSNTLFLGYEQGGGNVTYYPVQRNIYHYSAGGALEKVSTYEVGNQGAPLTLSQEYLYVQLDTKKNPLTVLADFSDVIFQQPLNANNALLEKTIDASGAQIESSQNVYTYDPSGYPLTCRTTLTFAGGGAPVVSNVKYIY